MSQHGISIYVIMIVSKVYDREEPWKPKTSGAFCASSDENAVLARAFEEQLEEHQKYKKENEDEQQRKVLHDHRDCLHIR